MTDHQSVGERISDERQWLGFTRAQFADAVKLNIDDLAAIEAGGREPSTAELHRIATVLRIDPRRLQGRGETR